MIKLNHNKNQLSKTHVKDMKYETTSQTTQQTKMLVVNAGPAQGLGKLGLGLRPTKKKNSLGKKGPIFHS